MPRPALWLALLMVAVGFAVSAMMLSLLGVPYATAGGGALTKIHPATMIGVLAMAANVLLRPRPLAYLAALPDRFPGGAVFAFCWIFMIVWAQAVMKVPVMPLVDAYLCALAFLVLYEDMDEAARAWLRAGMHLFFFVNAGLGLFEFVTGMRLTPYVAAGFEIVHDYRSTALLGHPLVNAAATGAYMVALGYGGDRMLGKWLRLAAILFQGAAMVAFGGRTAMALTALFLALALAPPFLRVLNGARFDPRLLLAAACAGPLAMGGIAVVVSRGGLDQFLERFTDDKGSAQARVAMFDLFGYFTPEQLLFGPDPERLAWAQNLVGIEYGIENSWLGFLFQYGALASAVFLFGLAALTWDFARRVGRGRAPLLVYLFVLASSAASLSVKSFMYIQIMQVMTVLLAPGARGGRNPGPGGEVRFSDGPDGATGR